MCCEEKEDMKSNVMCCEEKEDMKCAVEEKEEMRRNEE